MIPYTNPADMSATGAIFSDDEKYRYLLWRRWGAGSRYAHICGLNPSTADAAKNDPTIRREIDFCKQWGLDGLIKSNAFAFRATDPRKMMACADPVGLENDYWILRAVHLCEIQVAAWGVYGEYLHRNLALRHFCTWQCLGLTKNGHPRHPLYLPKSTKLVPLP